MGAPAVLDPSAPVEAAADWQVWGLDARLVVSDPAALPAARDLAEKMLADVTAACSRFEADSELSRVNAGTRPADGVELSPLLAEYVGVALDAARDTGGAVDPTLGADLERLGYDRDFAELPGLGVSATVSRPRRPGWERTTLQGRTLHLPEQLRLDLGATAKAYTADRIARVVSASTDCDVLVSLGGDIATSGRGGHRWGILVQDLPGDPGQTVSLPTGSAVATSSTQKRRWRDGGHERHHILDPRFGLPAETVWRSVSVAARTCLTANALSTAAIVKGRSAAGWLGARGADARLVAQDGSIVTTGGWPKEDLS